MWRFRACGHWSGRQTDIPDELKIRDEGRQTQLASFLRSRLSMVSGPENTVGLSQISTL
jgi:hypothetical protein